MKTKIKILCVILMIAMCAGVFFPANIVYSSAPRPSGGDVLGNVLYSNVVAYINGYPIPTSNIDGDTYVSVEQLENYGFDVDWDRDSRTLKVSLNAGKAFKPAPVEASAQPSGTIKSNYYYTDIKTYLTERLVPAYNIGGETLIFFDLLNAYGMVRWDQGSRSLRLETEAEEGFSPVCDITEIYLNGEKLTVQPKNFRENQFVTVGNPGGEIREDIKNLTVTGKLPAGTMIYIPDFNIQTAGGEITNSASWFSSRDMSQRIGVNGFYIAPGENLLYIRVLDRANKIYQLYTVSIIGTGDAAADAKYYAYPEPTIVVSNLNSLRLSVDTAQSGDVIGIAGGDYYVFSRPRNRRLVFSNKHNVILRSVSGDFSDVTLHGGGFHKAIGHGRPGQVHEEMLIISGGSSDITFYGITIRDINTNGFKLEGTNERNITIDSCRAIDVCERMIKGSGHSERFTYNLTVKNSWFENTQYPRTGHGEDHVLNPGGYVAGIDVMNLRGGLISNNVFLNIRGKNADGHYVSRGAMYFWGANGSADIIVENNLIIECDMGIVLGLSGQGVDGGIIRNNIIYNAAVDSIQTDSTVNVHIYNNTILFSHARDNDPGSRNRFNRGIRDVNYSRGLVIKNNIAHSIGSHDMAEDAIIENNIFENQTRRSDFANLNNPLRAEDFALTETAGRMLRQGIALPGYVDSDFFGNPRGITPDIGAIQSSAPAR
jgi:hypothetical protein